MKIYYSGNSSRDAVPEALLCDVSPDIMLTYHDFFHEVKDTGRRFVLHQKNQLKKGRKGALHAVTPARARKGKGAGGSTRW